MTSTSIILRNFFFFYISVINVGMWYIMPQTFFLTYYEQAKTGWMSFLQVLGIITAITAIQISHKKVLAHKSFLKRKKDVLYIFLLIFITFVSLFVIKNIALYFIIFIILKFALSYLYNYLDQYFIKITSESQIELHVRSHISYFIIANIIAPFYLSFFYDNIYLNISVFLLLLTFSFFFVSKYMTKDIRPRSEQKIDLKQDSLTINDWLFIIYAIVISVVIFSSASLIIYFVQDYYLMTDAKIKGGILLGLINIGTIFSIFLLGLAKKTPQTKRISIGHNLVAMLLLLVALLMFYLKLSVSFAYLSACGITAGIGYGLFLISTRNYASTVSIQCDRPQLLTAYNNTANSASLISFLIIFILSFLINYIPYDFYSVIFIINIALVLCSAAFFLLIRKTLL